MILWRTMVPRSCGCAGDGWRQWVVEDSREMNALVWVDESCRLSSGARGAKDE